MKATTAAFVLTLGVMTVGCAPMANRSTTTATTMRAAVLKEQWAPERGVKSIDIRPEGHAFVLHIDATRVCRVWGAEQQLRRHTWESKPATGAVVGDLVMVGTGGGTVLTSWAMTKDDCGATDILSTCDSTAGAISMIGAGLAMAGATALTVSLLQSDSGEETTTGLGRAIPPRYTACKNPSIGGSVVRLVAPNITLSVRLDPMGMARVQVPPRAWIGTGGAFDMDVVMGGRTIGRVLVRKEVP